MKPVRLLEADSPTEPRAVFIDPESVISIWPAGVPGCSTVCFGEGGRHLRIVTGNPDDVASALGLQEVADGPHS